MQEMFLLGLIEDRGSVWEKGMGERGVMRAKGDWKGQNFFLIKSLLL